MVHNWTSFSWSLAISPDFFLEVFGFMAFWIQIKIWITSRFTLKQLDYWRSISIHDSWLGLHPRKQCFLIFQVALVKKYHTNGDLYTSFQSQTLRYLKHIFASGVPHTFRRLNRISWQNRSIMFLSRAHVPADHREKGQTRWLATNEHSLWKACWLRLQKY